MGRSPLHLDKWAGCALLVSLASTPLYGASGSTAAVAWPPPPAQPCVRYETSLKGPADLGVKASAWSRFGKWVSGAAPTAQGLVRPFGLALDEAGNLLVTDTGANAVAYLDRAKKRWLRWDHAGAVAFRSPVAAARLGETFFVADSALGQVVAFDEKGTLRFQISQGLERPVGLAVAQGRLYIVDAQRHQVLCCDAAGQELNRFGQRGSGAGEFNFPTHISADASGQLYVTDSLNYRIEVFDSAGRFVRQIGSAGDSPGHFSRPKGVAADSAGRVFVVDGLADNVQLFDEQGRLLFYWGESGSGPGQFWMANGIVLSPSNELYVADAYNRRIQVFQFLGKP